MKSHKKQTMLLRRKREGKTDYRKRLKLLKSKKPRLVIRKSARNLLAQVIEYFPTGDRVIASVHSKALQKEGWGFSRTNLPAAYLVGLIIGMKAKKMKVTVLIADIGQHSSVGKSKIYALICGVKDAGIHIPISDEVIPSKERISGGHIVAFAKKLKPETEKFKRQFSGYAKQGIDAEKITETFEKIKAKILKG